MAEKLVHTGYCNGNTSAPIKVYVTYSETVNWASNSSTITCGMYITVASGWTIGSWTDFNGSYVGTTSLTFNGDIPSGTKGTRTLTSGKTFTVNHNSDGSGTATIYWKWGVNSPWGKVQNPSGSFSITLTKINKYTISYDANGGSGAPSAQTKTQNVNLTLSSTKPTRAGYTFKGWSTSSTATSATYNASSTYTANASVTLYAVWQANTYYVTYDANGGTGAPAQQAFTFGVGGTFSSTKPTRTGYTFSHWLSDPNGWTFQPGGAIPKDWGSFKLIAQWTPNTIKISLDPNGGSGGTSVFYYKYGINKFYSDANCSKQITSITRPTRTGYTFVHYYGDGSCGGTNGERYVAYDSTEFASDLCTDIYKDATLYGAWTINNYTLTINPNGGSYNGSTSTTTQTITYANGVSLNTPIKKGHLFVGWKNTGTSVSSLVDAGNGNCNAQSGYTETKSSDGTYTNYKVTLSTAPTSNTWYWIRFPYYTVAANDTVIISGYIRVNSTAGNNIMIYHSAQANDYNNAKQNFGSWNKDWTYFEVTRTFTAASTTALVEFYTSNLSGLTGTIDFDLKGITVTKNGSLVNQTTFTMPAGNVTMTAQWEPLVYTISYNANGGSGTMSSHTVSYGSTVKIKDNTFTKTNYKFIGWTTKSDGTDDGYGWSYASGAGWSGTWSYVDGQYGITKRQLVLYARWELDICYITYNGNGNIVSNVPSQQSATSGTTVQLSSTSPTRTRYKFLGWSTNSSATSASYQPGANYNVTGSITLYAVWQLLDKDIYLYKTGEIDAVDFVIVNSVSELFDSNGKVYGTEFITHTESNIYVANNGKIYAKNFIKY